MKLSSKGQTDSLCVKGHEGTLWEVFDRSSGS